MEPLNCHSRVWFKVVFLQNIFTFSAVAFAVNHGHHGNNHGHHHDHPNGQVACKSDSDCVGCMAGTTEVCMTDGFCKCLEHVPGITTERERERERERDDKESTKYIYLVAVFQTS